MVCSAEILENRLRAPLWAHILYKMFCKTVATIQEKNGVEFGCTVKRLMKLAGVESSDAWGIKSFSLKVCAISLSFYQNRNVTITNLQTLSKK